MAKPIKETPVLYGKDAKRFKDRIDKNKSITAPKEEYERIMSNYIRLKSEKGRD